MARASHLTQCPLPTPQAARNAGYRVVLLGVTGATVDAANAVAVGFGSAGVAPLDVIVGTSAAFSTNFFSYANWAQAVHLCVRCPAPHAPPPATFRDT